MRERSSSVAMGVTDDASAQLSRTFDELVANVRFVGYVAFRSPSRAEIPGALSTIFTRFAQSSRGLDRLALINNHHHILWSYGKLHQPSGGAFAISPSRLATDGLTTQGDYLHQLVELQMYNADGLRCGAVIGELLLRNPLAKADTQTVYLRQRSLPAVAITVSGMHTGAMPSGYVALATAHPAIPGVTIVAGMSPGALSRAISRAATRPILVVVLVWLLLMAIGVGGIELILASKARRVARYENARLAALGRRLSDLVLAHKDLVSCWSMPARHCGHTPMLNGSLQR